MKEKNLYKQGKQIDRHVCFRRPPTLNGNTSIAWNPENHIIYNKNKQN